MNLSLDEWADSLQKTALDTWEATGELPSLYVNIWRDDEPIYTFMCPSKGAALAASHVACVGMVADRIAITFEGWTTLQETNPATGEEWKSGDLSSYVEEHGDKDVVGNAIFTHVVSRGQEQASRAHRAFSDEGSGTLFEDMYPPEIRSAKPEGSMADHMITIMLEPSIDEQIKDSGEATLEQLDKEMGGRQQRMIFHDKAVIKRLVQEGALEGVIVISQKGTERDQILREALGAGEENTIQKVTPEDFLKKFM